MAQTWPDPGTKAELQLAVNIAALLLDLDACRAYGLLGGGIAINRARCNEILALGAAQGIKPK